MATPYPLGRIKSEPDERNFRLAMFMGDTPPTKLDVLLDAMMHSRESKVTKAWATEVTRILNGSTPAPPSPTPPPPPSKMWADAIQLDQGDTPQCVAFAWTAMSNSEPVTHSFDNDYAHGVYGDCKKLDGDAEDGTTVHTGAKVMKNRKEISGYAWAQGDLDLIKTWILTKGPSTVGTLWTAEMFDPDANGFVFPKGKIEGGHSYLLEGYDRAADVFAFQNSWGDWGVDGRFYMHAKDWWSLFNRDGDGEACMAVEFSP